MLNPHTSEPRIAIAYPRLAGEVLRIHRKVHHLSQIEVAHQLGVAHHSTVVRLERGDASPTLEQLAALADAFNKTPASLLAEVDALVAMVKHAGYCVPHSRRALETLVQTGTHREYSSSVINLFQSIERSTAYTSSSDGYADDPMDRLRQAISRSTELI